MAAPFYTYLEVKDGKPYGDQPGCGCCGGEVEITVKELDAYIVLLRARLEQAQEIRTKLFGPDYSN